VLLSDRLLAVFECGVVPNSAALDALIGNVFGRPVGSYAVVLTRADRIQTAEDLEVMQRMAWRLLVPGPKPDWNNQSLADHAVYLWSNQPVVSFLAERVWTDAAALIRWLRTPRGADTPVARELDQYRIFHALSLAEIAIRQREAEAIQPRAVPAQQLFAAQEAVIDLRHRILARVASDAAALKKTLIVSLQTLRQDLQDKLRSHLVHLDMPQSLSSDERKWLEETITAYIVHEVKSWQRQAEETISAWSRNLEDPLRAGLERMDWSLINQVAEQLGQSAGYPEKLYQHLLKFDDTLSMQETVFLGDPSESARVGFRNWGLGELIRGVMAGGLCSFLAQVLGAGPVSIATVGLVSGSAAYAYVRSTRLAHNLQLCETYGRQMINCAVEELEKRACHHLDEMDGRLRQTLQAEFDDIERLLENALSGLSAGGAASDQARSDREVLERLHRRLLEVVVI
jgi:hypothetical protein